MNTVKIKYSTCFELINTHVLVNCGFFIRERERERETERERERETQTRRRI
jgi:hypothetical protein